MFSRWTILGLFVCLAVVLGGQLPVLFTSNHSPYEFNLKLQAEPGAKIKIKSSRIVPFGNHQTTLTAQGDRLNFDPNLNPDHILFNEKHLGNYHLAFHRKQPARKEDDHIRHFHYVEVEHEGSTYGLLLPSFIQDVPALRTDQLYRCSNTLVWVEWRGDDAHIAAFSRHDEWRIAESIDNGFTNHERAVLYGYVIDRGHTQAVELMFSNGDKCFISKDNRVAKLRHTWHKETYDLDTILLLVGEGLVIEKRAAPEEL